MAITPEEASLKLRRAPNPNVTRIGIIYGCDPRRMVYPVIISNQPEAITEKFAERYEELVKDGYNNLMIVTTESYSLFYEWS